MDTLAKEVKQRLKELRLNKGLTEAELTSMLIEKDIDLKFGDINRFEREWDKLPSSEIIYGYCEIFKVDEDYIIFGNENKGWFKKIQSAIKIRIETFIMNILIKILKFKKGRHTSKFEK